MHWFGDRGPCEHCAAPGFLVELWGVSTYSCWRCLPEVSKALKPDREAAAA
jgi:hypothetical protein